MTVSSTAIEAIGVGRDVEWWRANRDPKDTVAAPAEEREVVRGVEQRDVLQPRVRDVVEAHEVRPPCRLLAAWGDNSHSAKGPARPKSGGPRRVFSGLY